MNCRCKGFNLVDTLINTCRTSKGRLTTNSSTCTSAAIESVKSKSLQLKPLNRKQKNILKQSTKTTNSHTSEVKRTMTVKKTEPHRVKQRTCKGHLKKLPRPKESIQVNNLLHWNLLTDSPFSLFSFSLSIRDVIRSFSYFFFFTNLYMSS